MGSLLYSAGGFGLPFYVIGTFCIVLTIALLILIPNVKRINNTNKSNRMDEVDNDDNDGGAEKEGNKLKPTMTLKHVAMVKCIGFFF